MRHIFSIICLAASTLTMQAQVKETLTSNSSKSTRLRSERFQATYDVAPLSQSRDIEAFLPATIDAGSAKITLICKNAAEAKRNFTLFANYRKNSSKAYEVLAYSIAKAIVHLASGNIYPKFASNSACKLSE